MKIVHDLRGVRAMVEKLSGPRVGWAVALGLVVTLTGLRTASGQSTWIGAGGTLANPRVWKDPKNWDAVPPVGGGVGYTLKFTGQNNAFVSSNNLGGNFQFSDLVLSTTFSGMNNGLTGQVIEGSSLFASASKTTPIPTIQQNGTGTFTILNKIDWGDAGIKLTGTAAGTVIFGKPGDPTMGILTGDGKNPLVIDSSGNASFYLYGNNDYTSGTKLMAGTLVIGRSTDEKTKNSAIGRGALTLSGGTIRAAEGQGRQVLFNPVTINGNTTLGARVNGLTQNDILTLAGPMTLANNPKLTVAAAEGDGTLVRTYLNGAISGNSGFTKDGPSILSLGGTEANTYTGTTTVAQGSLDLAKEPGIVAVPGNLVIGNGISTGQTVTLFNNGQIKDTAQVSIFQDATLNLQNKTQTIGSLADAGKGGGKVIIGAGSLTTGSAANTTYSGTFVGGGGTLVKTGNTVFTLTGKSDTFTGTVVVEQGKLALNKGQIGAKKTPLKAVEVKAGAVIAGTKGMGNNNLNIWANKVTVDAGGKMAPGMSPGILGVGASLDLKAGSHFAIVLAGPTAGDGPGHYAQLELVGGGTIQGSILDLSLEAAPGLHDRYTIIENLNSDFGTSDVTPLTGIFFDESGHALTNGSDIFASFDGMSYGFEVDYNQNASGYDVVLTDVSMSSVPEPSSSLLLTIGGAALLAVSARRPTTRRRGARRLLCCAAIGLALVDFTSASAGSILITAEWLEAHGSATTREDTSPGEVELDQAAKSFVRGDFDACLKQLGQAVRAHPELPPANALFARLAFLNGQPSLVRPALERAYSEGPAHPDVFIGFGEHALREGRLTDAALHFEKAAALASAPRWTTEQRRGLELVCHRGNAAVAEARGDWKAAQAALAGWLKLEPDDAPARQRLGKALFGLGQQNEAYHELERAADKDATLEPAAVTMGWLYAHAGDSKKAAEWMEYAVQAVPGSPLAHLALASWMLEQGRADLAQAHGDLACQFDPKSSDARRLLGLAARVRKDFAKSELIFQALADQSPGDVLLRNQLALVLAEQADQTKGRRALELAELSVRQDPEGPDTLATLAHVYYRLQRTEDAEKVLQAIVESGQASSDAAYTLARVKADQGNPEVALALIRTALAAPGLFIHRDDARQWLDRLEASSKK